jgi:outer membrane protein insertion porin family
LTILVAWVLPACAFAQRATPPSATTMPTPITRDVSGTASLKGRTVREVRVLGNTQVSTAVIRNLIRTREGERFDPATVEEDYQRVYGLKKFSNVEAKVEPTTDGGVIVVFAVTEQKQIRSITFHGNRKFTDAELEPTIDIKSGEAIDRFRIAIARQAIETQYRDANYPFAHVDLDENQLSQNGDLVFRIVEGPNVRVRKVTFKGNKSFTDDRLKEQVQTKSWVWIIRKGTYDSDAIDEDVAAVRRFYERKGFFDVRAGRKVIWSPDNTEVEVMFLVDEGPRYRIDRLSFRGNESLSERDLRRNLKLTEGAYYDYDVQQRDLREIVRAYSPFGFIYQPQSNDPSYLRIEPQRVLRKEAGKIDLVYEISEGRPFHIGQVLIRGNSKTQDKVIQRELRFQPGDLYNSGEVQDAMDRLRSGPANLFTSVNITPIGDAPDTRDVLIEANDRDAKTANFSIGAGVNSNGGVGGNVTFEQKNFDIANWPSRFSDIWEGNAFVGAGQTFRVSLEPGTKQTNASIRFTEPWLFDQPYSFTEEVYLRNRIREDYTDRRLGNRITLGKRFNYTYSGLLTLRTELVDIGDIQDRPIRADEILELEGQSAIISTIMQIRRDTTNRGLQPSRGTTTTLSWEQAGWLGGDFEFSKFNLGYDYYKTLGEDLLDRKTIFSIHADAGWITGAGDAPFFERFYGGGIGSIRGFAFRGVSPRSGPAEDRVGGDFLLTGSAEVSFPIAGDSLRGVVFTDMGTVETDVAMRDFRASVGAGIRLVLPILGRVPIAIDFAYPVSKISEDDVQYISFQLGLGQ